MDLIQKANKLGYKHYTAFTVEELDNLSLGNSNKQIEYYFIQKWLREEHKIHIAILPKTLSNNTIMYYSFTGKIKKDWIDLYDTYEEALEKRLFEALKLINNGTDEQS